MGVLCYNLTMRGSKLTWEATVLILVGVGIGVGYFILFSTPKKSAITTPIQQTSMSSFNISSQAFVMNGNIPALFTCDGKDISPELTFSAIPAGTQSLALIMHDPDAPRGVWTHWIAWNMPSTTTGIKENSAPPGVEGKNSGGKIGYGGPCPPDREHRYFFTLYALNSTLSLPQDSTKEELVRALTPHIIAKAELMGRYNRK